jgi:hypothetical protein
LIKKQHPTQRKEAIHGCQHDHRDQAEAPGL